MILDAGFVSGHAARPRRGLFLGACGVFESALEFLHDARHMPVHGAARAVRVVRGNRLDDRRVIADGLPAPARACENAAACGPTIRRAGPTSLRRQARASRCRSPWRCGNENRDRCLRESRNRRCSRPCARDSRTQRVDVCRRRMLSPPAPRSRPRRACARSAVRKGRDPRRCAVADVVRAVTKMPVPTRTSTRPPISSEMIASRTEARLTPSWDASSRSAGRREPARNSPLAIKPAIWSAICRYRRRARRPAEATRELLRRSHGCDRDWRSATVEPHDSTGTGSADYTLVKWSNHRTTAAPHRVPTRSTPVNLGRPMKITTCRVIVCCPGPQLRHAENRDRRGRSRRRRRDAQRPRARRRVVSRRPRHPDAHRTRSRRRSRTSGNTSTAARTGAAAR